MVSIIARPLIERTQREIDRAVVREGTRSTVHGRRHLGKFRLRPARYSREWKVGHRVRGSTERAQYCASAPRLWRTTGNNGWACIDRYPMSSRGFDISVKLVRAGIEPRSCQATHTKQCETQSEIRVSPCKAKMARSGRDQNAAGNWAPKDPLLRGGAFPAGS